MASCHFLMNDLGLLMGDRDRLNCYTHLFCPVVNLVLTFFWIIDCQQFLLNHFTPSERNADSVDVFEICYSKSYRCRAFKGTVA